MNSGRLVVVMVAACSGSKAPAPCTSAMSLVIERVAEDKKEMVQLANAAPREGEVRRDSDGWSSHDEHYQDAFVRSASRDALRAWVEPRRSGYEQKDHFEIRYGEEERGDERYWRTYYLAMHPIVTDRDIVGVEVDVSRPERSMVWFTLGERGRAAFAEATEAALGRKLAFELGDRVVAAPIIEGAIKRGRFAVRTIGTPDERVAEAKRIAAAFSCTN